MKTLFQEALLILVLLTVSLSAKSVKDVSSKVTDAETLSDDYSDESFESIEDDEILFSEDKPCPRDCICTASNGPRIARCSRLEVGTQQFGSDIVDLVVESLDGKYPLVLGDMIFKNLGLHQATSITIAYSYIKSISPKAFYGLNQLYSVNLSGNNINKIDPNTFAENKNLTLLTLSDNPLILSKVTPGQFFLNTSSVQELDISRSGIKVIPKSLFSKMTSLMYINLSGNKLQEIDSAVFKDLPDLEEVDLSGNFLKTIPEDLFAMNDEMTTLKIGGNPIKSVIGVLIKELLTLDVGMGKIKNIGPSMFDGMDLISNLNLSGNGVEKIHNQAFHKLKELNYLDLSNNNLEFVSDQLIKDNVDLDVFQISHNPSLKSLPAEGFECSAKHFNIYLFNASHCSIGNIQNNTFQTMPALSQLDLSNNKIKKISYAFQNLTKLVDLDISYNFISQLFKHNFEHNKDLAKLNLAGNPLLTISPEVFINSPNLARLDISYCSLTHLWEEKEFYFNGALSNLQFLNASYNDIKNINYKELEISNHLYTLDISENPLECTKDLLYLMVWLGHHNVSPSPKDVRISNLEISPRNNNEAKWDVLAKKLCSNSQAASMIEKTAPKKTKINPVSEKNSDYLIDDNEEDYYDPNDNIENNDDLEEVVAVEKLPSVSKDILTNPSTTVKIVTDIKQKATNTMVEKSIAKKQKLKDSDKYDVDEKGTNRVRNISFIDDMKTSNVLLSDVEYKTVDDIEQIISDSDHEIDFFEEDTDRLANGVIERKLIGSFPSRHQILHTRHLWMGFGIMFAICIFITIVFKIAALKKEAKKGLTIISVTTGSQGRVKKDCGLVYQQLSEDLTGSKTPIVSRYAPVSTGSTATNICYQSSPFHHSNITPESV